MLNKQQKEFRKQMKKAEKKKRKEGIEDPYSYQYENYQPVKERKGKVLFCIVLSLIIIVSLNLLSSLESNNETLQVKSWDTSEEEVHIYLSRTGEISQQLVDIWGKFSSMEEFEAMTNEELEDMKKDVMSLQTVVQSERDEFQELELYFLEQIMLTNKMINTYQEYKEKSSFMDGFHVNQLRNDFNENVLEEQFMVIRVLERQGISFELTEDGSISYQYRDSVLQNK